MTDDDEDKGKLNQSERDSDERYRADGGNLKRRHPLYESIRKNAVEIAVAREADEEAHPERIENSQSHQSAKTPT